MTKSMHWDKTVRIQGFWNLERCNTAQSMYTEASKHDCKNT